jgi:hypothetical protein
MPLAKWSESEKVRLRSWVQFTSSGPVLCTVCGQLVKIASYPYPYGLVDLVGGWKNGHVYSN